MPDRDTVIAMARRAGFHVGDQFVPGADEDTLKRFAALVAAQEREADTKVLEALEQARDSAVQRALEVRVMYAGYMNHRQKAADAEVALIDEAIAIIRARKEET